MRIYKEVVLTLSGGKYKIKQKDEEERLASAVDMVKFQEELELLYKTKEFRKFRRRQKFLRFVHFLMAFGISAFGIMCILSFFLVTDSDYSFMETLFSAFSLVMTLLFVLLLLTLWWEAKVLRPLRLQIVKDFTRAVQDRFLDTTFLIDADRFLSFRIRPIKAYEAAQRVGMEEMDYYDYINYNNPEDEDFYVKQNPYDLDPFEKNMREEWLREKEKEEAKLRKEKKKKNLLKLGK